jgi:hypothetical protein
MILYKKQMIKGGSPRGLAETSFPSYLLHALAENNY